jgi:hypothetical protein
MKKKHPAMKKSPLASLVMLVTLASLAAVFFTASAASAEINNYTIVNETGRNLGEIMCYDADTYGKPGSLDSRRFIFLSKLADGKSVTFDSTDTPLPDIEICLTASPVDDNGISTIAVGERQWGWVLRPVEGMTLTLFTGGLFTIE